MIVGQRRLSNTGSVPTGQKLPRGSWSFKEVGGVGVDGSDNVYVFNRGDHPMIIFDRDGNFLRSWGEGQYPRAHGVHMAPDDTMFLTDDGGHFVRKVTLDGKVLLELGVPGKPAPYMSGEPFHRCTHTALSPMGEIYVSDGYGNSRVHKYSPDGKLLMSWGAPGTGEGEFNIVHNICCDADGWVYVADRRAPPRPGVLAATANSKPNGRTCIVPAVSAYPTGISRSSMLARSVRRPRSAATSPTSGRSVGSIVDHRRPAQIGRFGEDAGGHRSSASSWPPHGLAVDSRGDDHVGEVSWTGWPQIFPDTPRPEHIRCLQKFEKVAYPLVWGHGPRVLEVFLEPTCPHSCRAFGKLDALLDQMGGACITVKLRLQSQPWHMYIWRDRALHHRRLDPRKREGSGEIRHGGGGRASRRV